MVSQLGQHQVDSTLAAERFAAADAAERFFLVEHLRQAALFGVGDIQRLQGNGLFRAAGGAQPTLHAAVGVKAQLRLADTAFQCFQRANGGAGEAQRAGILVDLQHAEGCASR